MSVSDYIVCTVGGGIALFFALQVWSFWGKLTGDTTIPWSRRLFWRNTVEDLFSELKTGKRNEISGLEVEMAKALEKRQLPPSTRFPKAGEIYEALQDFQVSYLTAHSSPFTGGGTAILPKGERIRVCEPLTSQPLSVCCDPLNYDTLQKQIVSEEERKHERYTGYYFSLKTVDLNQHFRLVETVESEQEGNIDSETKKRGR